MYPHSTHRALPQVTSSRAVPPQTNQTSTTTRIPPPSPHACPPHLSPPLQHTIPSHPPTPSKSNPCAHRDPHPRLLAECAIHASERPRAPRTTHPSQQQLPARSPLTAGQRSSLTPAGLASPTAAPAPGEPHLAVGGGLLDVDVAHGGEKRVPAGDQPSRPDSRLRFACNAAYPSEPPAILDAPTPPREVGRWLPKPGRRTKG